MESPGEIQRPVIAIMQPTFCPWLGYFDLIDRVDAFVYLDDVQLSRQSFQTRNRIKGTSPQPRWLSVPHEHGTPLVDRLIASTPIVDPNGAGNRVANVLASFYRGSPWLAEVDDLLRRAFASQQMLGALNIAIINGVCEYLGIDTRRVLSTDLGVEERRSGKVMGILNNLAWGTYVAVPGAVDYMVSDGVFEPLGDRVLVQSFETVAYHQRGEGDFTSHMSILDALLEVGPESTLEVIRAGRRPLRTLIEVAKDHRG